MKKSIVTLACLLSVTLLAVAQSDGVSSTLTVSRIVAGANGKEAREPAAAAKPGDVLEYVAEYRNAGKTPARKLEAMLPIPTGTEFLPASAKPGAIRASIDGTRFEAVPLKRKVRRADGTMKDELVPYAEYRFLRWAPRDLPAGRAATYRARVRLVTDASAPSVN